MLKMLDVMLGIGTILITISSLFLSFLPWNWKLFAIAVFGACITIVIFLVPGSHTNFMIKAMLCVVLANLHIFVLKKNPPTGTFKNSQ